MCGQGQPTLQVGGQCGVFIQVCHYIRANNMFKCAMILE